MANVEGVSTTHFKGRHISKGRFAGSGPESAMIRVPRILPAIGAFPGLP